MKALCCLAVLLLFPGSWQAQPAYLHTLKGDSLNVAGMAVRKPVVLVYYTDRSCYDCFGTLHDFFQNDTSKQVLFVIEKTNAPLLNVEIRQKLMKKGVAGRQIWFSPLVTHEVSPYIDLINGKSRKRVPYASIFDSGNSFEVSEAFRILVRE